MGRVVDRRDEGRVVRREDEVGRSWERGMVVRWEEERVEKSGEERKSGGREAKMGEGKR